MNLFKKIVSVILCAGLLVTAFTSCKTNKQNVPASESGFPSASETAAPIPTEEPVPDESATVEYVAKVGNMKVYESDFWYFLYQGMRETYYQYATVYDENATDEENIAKMIEFFNSKAEDGRTYLEIAVESTLKTAKGFKIASDLGHKAGEKDKKYVITDDQKAEMNAMIDSEADYGATMYNCSRDKYFVYAFGMNVNDSKRYSEEQLYAEMSETAWADEKGFSVGAEEPTEPQEPDENATDEQKAAYDKAKEAYDKELAAYKKVLDKYYEKFRDDYNADEDVYAINTARYLELKVKDGDKAACAAEAKKLKDLADGGMDFAKMVKGYSESDTIDTDLGIVDVDLCAEELPAIGDDLIEFIADHDKISKEIEILETDYSVYLVQIVGRTTFDKQEGEIADKTLVSTDTVRKNVEFSVLVNKYNAYIETFFDNEEYKTCEENKTRMIELATKYLNDSADTERE